METKMFDLTGKVAIITGGAGKLGMEYAEILSGAGACVVIADINGKLAREKAEYIAKKNRIEALGIQVDISDKKSVERMVEETIKKFKKIDILINNAAIQTKNFFACFEDYPLEDWEKVISVNLTGTFLCSQAAGREMLKQGGGVIVNIASIYGIVAPDKRIYGNSGINTPAVYSASKAGIIGLTKYLAAYWADKNIRVNSITPGGVFDNQDPEFVRKYSNRTPMGRMANKKELRGAILYLVSDASSYVTGHNLIVDGGLSIW